MCSFLMTNIDKAVLYDANWYQRFRGPDLTSVSKMCGFTFVHNLLSITGSVQPQPLVESGVACVYNGEIYNFNEFGGFSSDGECIIPLYLQSGLDFTRVLDGEFALAMADFNAGRIILATDVFGTKPLHYAIEDGKFAVSSYSSALAALGFKAPVKVAPNTLLVINLKDLSLKSSQTIWSFSTAQNKHDLDVWVEAFEAAVRKRVFNVREKLFIGLSSGYDSGAIACELARQKVTFATYSILGNEDEEIVRARIKAISPQATSVLLRPNEAEFSSSKSLIEDRIEELFYEIYSSSSDFMLNSRMHDDPAACGLAIIFSLAKAEGHKIYLSGQGADEITSDYGFAGKKIYGHSNFGGLFPNDLGSIFPWASFYGSSQASYLMKEEYVAGAFGIEARYPYLDRQLVQEFLSLDPRLKNSAYKAPLRYYLEKYSFPCAFDKKFGFTRGSANVFAGAG